jgi:plastocyanin
MCEDVEKVRRGPMKRLVYLTPLSVIVVLVFASIALAQDSSSGGGEDPAQNALTVSIHDHAFDPAQLDVAPGTTVTWVNNDTEPQTATSDDGELFDSGVLQPGQSYSVWLDGSGTVTYHSELNPDMQGTLVVGGSGSGEDTTSGEDTGSGGDTSSGQPASDPMASNPTQMVNGTLDIPGSSSQQNS